MTNFYVALWGRSLLCLFSIFFILFFCNGLFECKPRGPPVLLYVFLCEYSTSVHFIFFLYLKVSQFKLIFLFNSFCFVLFLLERIFVSAAGGEGEGEGIHVCLTLLCVMLEKSNKQI